MTERPDVMRLVNAEMASAAGKIPPALHAVASTLLPTAAWHAATFTDTASAGEYTVDTATALKEASRALEFTDQRAYYVLGLMAAALVQIQRCRALDNELRAAWGDLHVQDNSGLLPDLHQGMWR